VPIALDVGSLADAERRPFLLRLGPSDCDQYVTKSVAPPAVPCPLLPIVRPDTGQKRAELALPRRLDEHANSGCGWQRGARYLA
jgi:hypothetical protein